MGEMWGTGVRMSAHCVKELVVTYIRPARARTAPIYLEEVIASSLIRFKRAQNFSIDVGTPLGSHESPLGPHGGPAIPWHPMENDHG